MSMERIAAALERIADAQQAMAESDPLTMLNAAMGDDLMAGEPEAPIASNGMTIVYRHPDPSLRFVARRDKHAEGGYTVDVERA